MSSPLPAARAWVADRVRGSAAVRRLISRLRQLLDRVDREPVAPPVEAAPAVLRYRIDEPVAGVAVTGTVRIRGWAAMGDRPVLAVAVHLDGHLVGHAATGTVERLDLVEALGWESMRWAGWDFEVDLGACYTGAAAHLVVTVWPDGGERPIVLDPVPVVLDPQRRDGPELVDGDELRAGLDRPEVGATVGPDAVRLEGWVYHDRYPVSSLDVVANGRHVGRARLGLARPELAGPGLPPRAAVSGFEHVLDLGDLPESERVVRVQLVARASGGRPVVAASRVLRRRPVPDVAEPVPAAARSIRVAAPEAAAREALAFDLVVFTHQLGYGGGQLWLSELLARAGAGRAFPCTVVSPADGPLRVELERAGIRVRVTQPFPVDSLASYEGRVDELSALVASGGHTAALVNTLSLAIGADVTRRLGIPTVWAIHESFPASTFWSHALGGGALPPGIRARFEETLRTTSCLVFEAEATRGLYADLAGPGRSLVVPYGIDTATVEAFVAATDRAEVREGLGLAPDRRVALVMGTTEPRKAQTRLAEAFALVADEYPDWDLVFVGDTGTPYADALRRYVADTGLDGRVRIVPVVPDVHPWYRAADVLVSASDVESLPRSALEAMCFGVPVLATSVFGLPELITDGCTGFLVEPGALDALVAGFRRVLGGGAVPDPGGGRTRPPTDPRPLRLLRVRRRYRRPARGAAARSHGRPVRGGPGPRRRTAYVTTSERGAMPEATEDPTRRTSSDRLAELESTVARLEAVVAGQAEWMAVLQAERTEAPGDVAGLAAGLASHTEWLSTLERWVSSCVTILANFGAQPLDTGTPSASGSLDVPGTLMSRLEVLTVMDWVAAVAEVPDGPTVSVNIATRDRPELLRMAVDSVLAQSYGRFEIVVADDSDGDATGRLLAAYGDERIRVVPTPGHHGGALAFNTALGASTGDIITFLDDDNLMHPDWLRSVVWAFSTFDGLEALYGARVNEDPGAEHGVRSGMLPLLEFTHYDRDRHELANFVDRNTIAHLARHADLRHDEQLAGAIDWDYSLRLFTRSTPLALPAIACYYRTVVPGRISDSPEKLESFHRVRARAHTTRPLRVHVHSAMFPVLCETYIAQDIDNLVEAGATVTVSSDQVAVSGGDDPHECSLDPDGAIASAAPDVVLLHWATNAWASRPLLEKHGIPFVLRLHSFDFDPDMIQELGEHPLCAGIIGFGHQLDRLPDGAVGMVQTIGPQVVVPPSPAERDGILSASAGVPKKDFPMLVDVMSRLPTMGKRIIMARTNGFESLPGEVAALAQERDPAITVSVDVPRPDVLEALARTSVLVYTVDPSQPLGSPMSIIEAMLCGAVVIAPDRPEIHDLVGPELRAYRTPADIVRHTEEVAAGGPEVEAARDALRLRGEAHRDPSSRAQLHRILNERLTGWKSRRA